MPDAQGSLYPLDGNVQVHIGGIQASSLEMTRLILPLHVNPQVIRNNLGFMSSFAYDLGVSKKKRTIGVVEFRYFKEAEGRFAHLLPKKEGDEPPTILH